MLCMILLGACVAVLSGCYMLLLNHNPLHIVIQCEHMALWLWTAFFNGQKMCKSHGNKSGLYTGSLSNYCCVEFSWSWSCGLHRIGQCWTVGWCHLWVYNEDFSWLWYVAFESPDSEPSQTVSKCDFKPRNRGPLMSWFSQDGIMTWYDIFKLSCDVICTNWSTSQP